MLADVGRVVEINPGPTLVGIGVECGMTVFETREAHAVAHLAAVVRNRAQVRALPGMFDVATRTLHFFGGWSEHVVRDFDRPRPVAARRDGGFR